MPPADEHPDAEPLIGLLSWGSARSRSVWRWQLILAVSAVAVLATYVVLTSAAFLEPGFLAGTLALIGITALTLIVPWHRTSKAAIALIPFADIVAVGLMSLGGETRAAMLWVFPICWLATYYRLPWLIAGMSMIAIIIAAETIADGVTAVLVQRALILLLCLVFMGVTLNIGARRTRAYGRLLRRQSAQLDRTRQRAENQARRVAQLIDSLDTGLARFDRDGVLVDANQAFLRLYGASSLSEFTPTGAVEYSAHRGKPVDLERTFVARATAGERLDEYRTWLYSAQSRWHAFDIETRKSTTPDGERPATLVVLYDVTEAIAAERRRKTVSSVVSHELRNPLTAISGHADLLLERDDLPEDVLSQIGIIENAAGRMQRLLTSALSDTSTVPVAPEPVDLCEIAQAAATAFGPAVTAAQITLTVDLQGGCLALGDAFRLRQAIDNLIGNAIKYTPRGGQVRVEVGARAGEEDAGDVTVSIIDTGIGMTDEDRLRMFERGYRSPSVRTSGIPGSGIGLPVVREILDAHDGRLEVHSTPGGGSTFTIVLPRLTPATEKDGRHQ